MASKISLRSKVWSTNDAYQLMRQITKQPALLERIIVMENNVFRYKSIAECFSNYFVYVFVEDNSEVSIQLNQNPEKFPDDIQFSEGVLSNEVKNIRSGANDGMSPKFLMSSLPYISNPPLFTFSCCLSKCEFPTLWEKCISNLFQKR